VGISIMARAILSSLLLMCAAPICPTKALSQGETTSAILGQVTDAANAALPGTTVTITNRTTALQRVAKTDDQGRFNFLQLRPGIYSVKAEAEGFDPQQTDTVFPGLGQEHRTAAEN